MTQLTTEEINFQPSIDERVRMTALAVAHNEELRRLVAERIAFRLVENTNAYRMRHFLVIDDRRPVPFPTHWRHKNTSGVTFKRNEGAAAQAWVVRALLAGFTVFYRPTKRSGGFGRGLKDGIYSEDGWWLHQELRARGIES